MIVSYAHHIEINKSRNKEINDCYTLSLVKEDSYDIWRSIKKYQGSAYPTVLRILL